MDFDYDFIEKYANEFEKLSCTHEEAVELVVRAIELITTVFQFTAEELKEILER